MTNTANYRSEAEHAARRHGLPVKYFVNQIGQESGFNPNAKSPAGAEGIGQFMPDTARGLGIDPYNPHQALDAAAKLMAGYVQQFGSYEKALRAYNAGPGHVRESYGYSETNNYVKSILGGGVYGGGPRARQASHGHGGGGGTPGYETTTTTTSIDPAARRALLLNYVNDRSSPDALLTLAAGLRNLPQTSTATSYTPGTPGVSPSTGGSGSGHRKTVSFDGKPVVGWIAKELKRARATGLWTGAVTSGERTRSQQLAAAKRFGLQHYGPAGPLGSNHVVGHDGAVDVSDPDGLAKALAKIGSPLRRGMSDDPVHFSRTGH